MKLRHLLGQLVLAICVTVVLSGCESVKSSVRNMDLDHEYQRQMDLTETYVNTPKITSTRLANPEGTGDIIRPRAVKEETGFNSASIAYPTGRKDSSALLLTKRTPKIVRSGSAYKYFIEIQNLTNLTLQDVNVSEIIPEGFQLQSVTPKESRKNGDNLNWNFGKLNPGETRAITLTGKANATDELPCCTSATYAPPALCLNTGIVKPGLSVALEAPSSKVICDTIPIEYTVKNTGDSVLQDVVIEGKLPSGITVGGNSSVMIKAGNLAQGQTRTFTKVAKAAKTGSFSLSATAQDNTDISARSSVQTTRVIRPSIDVSASAKRSKQYVGRDVGYNVTVRNNGSIATQDTTVVASIPAGAKFKSATMGGSGSGSAVRWNIGSLAAGASKTLNFDVVAGRAGDAKTDVEAKAYCCTDTSLAKAKIEGIPALLLEVVDLQDPIEIGDSQTYEIVVTNQGSATANNVKIEAILEGMMYQTSTGPSTGSASGNTVSLGNIPRIPAKDKVTWRITAKANATGDKRFSVKMNSDELGRPVEETESTFVY